MNRILQSFFKLKCDRENYQFLKPKYQTLTAKKQIPLKMFPRPKSYNNLYKISSCLK